MLGNAIIDLKQVLDFIEMVLKCGNDFEISEFYLHWTFFNKHDEFFFEVLKFSEK